MADRVYHLFIGRKFTGISVEPDPTWTAMWRVRQADGRLSGMLNLTRARECAFACARPKGLGGREVAHWQYREIASEARPIEFLRMEAAE